MSSSIAFKRIKLLVIIKMLPQRILWTIVRRAFTPRPTSHVKRLQERATSVSSDFPVSLFLVIGPSNTSNWIDKKIRLLALVFPSLPLIGSLLPKFHYEVGPDILFVRLQTTSVLVHHRQ